MTTKEKEQTFKELLQKSQKAIVVNEKNVETVVKKLMGK